MTDADLADRILAALLESERRDRQPVVRSNQVLAHLAAAEDEVRSAISALDTQGRVRWTPGGVAGDVVVLPGTTPLHDATDPHATALRDHRAAAQAAGRRRRVAVDACAAQCEHRRQ